MATFNSYGNRQISAPHKIPLNQSTKKLAQLITSTRGPPVPNLVEIHPLGALGKWVKYNQNYFYLFIPSLLTVVWILVMWVTYCTLNWCLKQTCLCELSCQSVRIEFCTNHIDWPASMLCYCSTRSPWQSVVYCHNAIISAGLMDCSFPSAERHHSSLWALILPGLPCWW